MPGMPSTSAVGQCNSTPPPVVIAMLPDVGVSQRTLFVNERTGAESPESLCSVAPQPTPCETDLKRSPSDSGVNELSHGRGKQWTQLRHGDPREVTEIVHPRLSERPEWRKPPPGSRGRRAQVSRVSQIEWSTKRPETDRGWRRRRCYSRSARSVRCSEPSPWRATKASNHDRPSPRQRWPSPRRSNWPFSTNRTS